MPDFRGVRFSQGTTKFKPPRPDQTVIPAGLGTLGAGKPPHTTTGPEAFCAGNQEFIGGTVSLPECYAYWALQIILGPEGVKWGYQSSVLGGRHVPGGAVVDFVVYDTLDQDGHHKQIGIRVQGWFFHLAQGAIKQAADEEQLLVLSDYGMIVIDVYDFELIRDETGKSALWVMHDAVSLIQHPDPLVSGMSIPQ